MAVDLIVDTSRRGAKMCLLFEGEFPLEASSARAQDSERIGKEIFEESARGEQLSSILASFLEREQVSVDSIARVLVLSGPGSFTGLRTGIAFCEGLCFSGKRNLYGISTLRALAAASPSEAAATLLFARPGFWYFRPAIHFSENASESFLSKEEGEKNLQNINGELVLDSKSLASDLNFSSYQNISLIREESLKLSSMGKIFSLDIKPSLKQEANYIQSSYAERSAPDVR